MIETSRRTFLQGTGATLGAGALLGACGAAIEGKGSRPMPPAAGDWAAVKAEFALSPGLAHMAGFFLASHPRVVREAIETHRRGLDADPFEYIGQNIKRLEKEVRRAAADYLGVGPDDVAMTDSTTMGLGIVYGGLVLRPGQEILSTTHDHIVTAQTLDARAARSGQPVRRIALYDDPAEAETGVMADRLARALRPATRVVALTWVHSGTGVKLPIRRLADVLAQANAGRKPDDRALLFVDGVHGLGVEDVTMADLGCDFFIAGCHKWLFGPRGTGLVWARHDAWSAVAPIITSMDPMWRPGAHETMPPAAFMTPGGFHSFEHRWAVSEAFRFHLALGKAQVAARIHALTHHLKEELARIPRVRLVTPRPPDVSAGIVCFAVEGKSPRQVVAELRHREVVASVTPSFYVPGYARLAPGLITVEADVEKAAAAVRALA